MIEVVTLISIVVPAYNAEPFLGATLESIVSQSVDDWECWVVDDGSTDGTHAIAATYAARDSRIRVVPGTHRGVSAARNAGFRASHPDARYLSFMDADDIWVPTALDTLLARLRETPQAIGAYGVADFIDEKGDALRPGEFAEKSRRRRRELVGRRFQELPPDAPSDFSTLVCGGPIFPFGVMLVKRDAYLRAGAFDETLTVGEDWDMQVRLSRLGLLAFTPAVVVGYRRHNGNAGAAHTAPAAAHHAYCQTFYSPSNSPEQRRIVRRVWRADQRARMGQLWREVRTGPVPASANLLARLAVVATRYAAGGPRPKVRRIPPSW